ncbi:MAG: hypothetical protein KME21_25155 [Desmonostoc vinosum HA7617-LM4]|jgi:hypothetical protein|nr:hypothetical protein [Desmonostoc vinosum HA7617-LM4]
MRRLLTYILVVLFSLFVVIFWWPLNDSDCNSEAFLASKTKKIQIPATKVVVQPWRGGHRVYGIFMVPNEYKQAPFFILTVKGVGNYCSKSFGYSQQLDNVFAQPGTHLVRDFVRTRVALRLIMQGLYSQLNDRQNWTLTYPRQNNS